MFNFLNNEQVLAQICQITTISLYLSGSQVIKSIIKKGSTHGISILPFLTCAVSCTIWLKYALLKQDHVLIITNGFGTCLEWIYVLVYLSYLPVDVSKSSSTRRWLIIQITFMFGILITCSRPKFSDDEMEKLLELMVKVCVFTNICNYASPLGQALHCVSIKSTENLSIALSTTYWLQIVSWLQYGIVTGKTVVIIPNAMGIFLSSFIMSLFFIYPRKRLHDDSLSRRYGYIDDVNRPTHPRINSFHKFEIDIPTDHSQRSQSVSHTEQHIYSRINTSRKSNFKMFSRDDFEKTRLIEGERHII